MQKAPVSIHSISKSPVKSSLLVFFKKRGYGWPNAHQSTDCWIRATRDTVCFSSSLNGGSKGGAPMPFHSIRGSKCSSRHGIHEVRCDVRCCCYDLNHEEAKIAVQLPSAPSRALLGRNRLEYGALEHSSHG